MMRSSKSLRRSAARPPRPQTLPATLLALWLLLSPHAAGASAVRQDEPQNTLAEATALMERVPELYRQGKYDEALTLAERALALRESKLGGTILLAATLIQVAVLYHKKGDLAESEAKLLRALTIYEQVLGAESLPYARTLNGLGVLLRDRGDLRGAEKRLLEAQTILEKLTGADAAFVATVVGNLASLYQDQGRYAEAEGKYHEALRVLRAARGEEDAGVALILSNLAVLHQFKGDLVEAERLLERVLALRRKALGEGHPDVAISLNNLSMLYQVKGDRARAETLLLRGLDSLKKTHGEKHPNVATLLNNLADLRMAGGDLAGARQLLETALSIREAAYGKEHPDVATCLNNLGTVNKLQGDNVTAGGLWERALAMYRKFLGDEHPDVALALQNLASAHQSAGRYGLAEEQLLRALRVREKALGARHPDVALTLYALAELRREQGNVAGAVALFERASAIREHHLGLILATGSENQKRLYLATLNSESSELISFNAESAPASPAASRLGLTTVLRRKGRVLDVMAAQVAALRRRADEQGRSLLNQLLERRSHLANLLLGGAVGPKPPAAPALVAELEADIERLEREVSARHAELLAPERPATPELIQQALPPGAALVELVQYRPFRPQAKTGREYFGEPRYVAYVLRREGAPRFVELGAASAIDSAARRFRLALNQPGGAGARPAGRALDELLMRPLRRLLGAERLLLLSPDGELNLIPFSALVDERGRYLVERYTVNYLTSGRDMLRPWGQAGSRQPPLVIADPAFDLSPPGLGRADEAAEGGATRGGRALRSGDLGELKWKPLKETSVEAGEIRRLLADASVLVKAEATEAALKQVAGPRILHIATHGFFLQNRAPQAGAGGEGAGERGPLDENPLLRSGLALTGSNQRSGGGGEDGILTALEAAGLDLWGTRLVVLSACRTGVGEVRNGEGVYGLRRALVLAGAESELMSLWLVSDQATRELMVKFYRRVQAGEGRAEALRGVQLEMLRQARRRHPYFWAAFIPIGDWRALTPAGPVAKE